MARAGRYDLDLPSLRSAAPSQGRKNENSNAHGITPVQKICFEKKDRLAPRATRLVECSLVKFTKWSATIASTVMYLT